MQLKKDVSIFIKQYHYHILLIAANHKAGFYREKKLQLTSASFSKPMSSF